MADEEKTEEKVEEKVEETVEEKAPEASKEEPKAEAKPEKAEAKEEKKDVPAKFKDLVATIDKLSVLELSELVKVLEDHYGVSAAAPAAVAAAPAAGGDAGGDAAEEKAAYTVVLAAAGDQKINVIKAVRELTGLGLAESKAIVDGAPKPIKENVPKAEADEAKAALEGAGATVEVK
jgi:large subunit ribosomal protein L7/L12